MDIREAQQQRELDEYIVKVFSLTQLKECKEEWDRLVKNGLIPLPQPR